MRIVIDTNVIASAIFFGGRPKELIEHLVSHKLEAYASKDIITEYQETVEELCDKYPSKPQKLPLSNIVAAIKLISPVSDIKICRDPDDDMFINCAVDANCLYIVSGDKDLLSIERHDKVQIITVSEFFQIWSPPKTEQ